MKSIKRQRISVLLIVFLILSNAGIYAHSGRTDSSGGHRDNNNVSGLGPYHYHHGYGPHLHPGGVCPYLNQSQPNADAGSSSSSSNAAADTAMNINTGTGQTDEVEVALPGFTITINGNVIDNSYAKYPFIVYKNITYIPMTWSLCRHLGISSKFSAAEGLTLVNNKENLAAYEGEEALQTANPSTLGNATIAKYKITVNDQMIDNTEEAYPILQFRDITYFPLTWNYVTNEFELQLSFSQEDGLVISY